MTQEELQRLVERVSLESFGRPFLHQAVFNNRLRSTGGRYHLGDHHLDFNRKLFEVISQEEQLGIIKHELCHYHLHLTGRGYRHRDQDFKMLLKKTGGSRYAPALPQQPSAGYWYRCEHCHLKLHRKRRIDTKRYVCGKCRGPLVLLPAAEFKRNA